MTTCGNNIIGATKFSSFHTASAEGSHPGSTYERLLWRKPTLKSHFSAAETDPEETPTLSKQ
jgi:hypothetical protein